MKKFTTKKVVAVAVAATLAFGSLASAMVGRSGDAKTVIADPEYFYDFEGENPLANKGTEAVSDAAIVGGGEIKTESENSFFDNGSEDVVDATNKGTKYLSLPKEIVNTIHKSENHAVTVSMKIKTMAGKYSNWSPVLAIDSVGNSQSWPCLAFEIRGTAAWNAAGFYNGDNAGEPSLTEKYGDGGWHTLTISLSETAITSYIDGEQFVKTTGDTNAAHDPADEVTVAEAVRNIFDNGDNFFAGADRVALGGNQPFWPDMDAQIYYDDVAIFSKELTANEAAALASGDYIFEKDVEPDPTPTPGGNTPGTDPSDNPATGPSIKPSEDPSDGPSDEPTATPSATPTGNPDKPNDFTDPTFEGTVISTQKESFENTINGTTVGSKLSEAASKEAPTYVDGYSGKGVSFTGAGSDGIKLNIAPKSNKYVVSFWMNLRAATQYSPAVLMGNYVDGAFAGGADNAQWISIAPLGWKTALSDGPMIWSRNIPGGKAWNDLVPETTNSLSLNAWHKVAVAADGATADLYVDGVKVGTGPIADIINDTTTTFVGVNDWDTPLNGVIDEIKITSYSGSATEPTATPPAPTQTPGGGTDVKPSTSPSTSPSAQPQGKVTKVTVKVPNRKAGKTINVKKGDKVTLKAAVTGTGTFTKGVTYKSSKTKVATVSSKGVVKAKKKGTAKITVTSKFDKTKKATITIKVSNKKVANKKLTLKVKKKSLKKGKTFTVAIKSMTKNTTEKVTYKTSKKSVATVDNYGVVKAKKKGKATITVKCGKKKATVKVTVK